MFTADDIHKRIKSQPFVPVRIMTSGGQSFDVLHPDLIMVGRRFVEIGTASAENPLTFDNVTRVAVLHVTALEDLTMPTPPGGNGKQ